LLKRKASQRKMPLKATRRARLWVGLGILERGACADIAVDEVVAEA
jgi:hypothetical protein